MKKLLLLLLLTGAASASPAVAPPESLLSLADAMARARQTDPSLQRLQAKVEEASYAVDEAHVPGNPKAQFDSRYFHLTPTLSFTGLPTPAPIVVGDNWSVGAQIEQALHTFGRVKWGVATAELKKAAEQCDLRRRGETLDYQVRLAYSRLTAAEEAVGVAQASLDAFCRAKKELDLQLTAGSIPRFNVLVGELALSQGDQRLLQAQQEVELARADLNALLGWPPQHPLRLAPLEPTPDGESIAPLATMLSVAEHQRGELQALDKTLQSARAHVSFEKSQAAPELGAFSRYERRNGYAFQSDQQWTVGVQLRVPLFDGGMEAARIGQAQAEVRQLEATREEQRRLIAVEVEKARTHLALSQQRRQVAAAQLTLAEEALRLAELRFRVGAGTQQELLDVQARRAQARYDGLEARRQSREARWELDLALDAP